MNYPWNDFRGVSATRGNHSHAACFPPYTGTAATETVRYHALIPLDCNPQHTPAHTGDPPTAPPPRDTLSSAAEATASEPGPQAGHSSPPGPLLALQTAGKVGKVRPTRPMAARNTRLTSTHPWFGDSLSIVGVCVSAERQYCHMPCVNFAPRPNRLLQHGPTSFQLLSHPVTPILASSTETSGLIHSEKRKEEPFRSCYTLPPLLILMFPRFRPGADGRYLLSVPSGGVALVVSTGPLRLRGRLERQRFDRT